MTAEPWVSVEGVAKHLGVAKDDIFTAHNLQGLPPVFSHLGLLRNEEGEAELNAAPIVAELRREAEGNEEVVALAREMLTDHRLALSGLREECARLIGVGKKVVVS